MSQIVYSNVITYACACGVTLPLAKLYFCRHCLQLRCGFCLCHEVDSHFCSNCLENIPSSEAKHKKYRCNSCFDCPSCQHTLSARATTVVVPASAKKGAAKEVVDKEAGESSSSSVAEGTTTTTTKGETKKMFYLSCLACRWSTRDVGIPDQTVATGSWPEAGHNYATRFGQLLEHYQSVVLFEKQEKQELWRRKTPRQHKFALAERVNVSLVRRQLGWTDKTSAPKIKVADIRASVAGTAINDLPEDIFTKPISLKRFTTIEQRLGHPAGQPCTVNNLFPQHKSLSIKRSLRCRQCEHNVVKPEFNPTSIKYRIQLFASYHLPEVRVMQSDGRNMVQLQFINPTMNDMQITLLPLSTEIVGDEQVVVGDLKKLSMTPVAPATTTTEGESLSSLPSKVALNEDPRPVKVDTNGEVILPEKASFVVNHRDESIEYDEVVVQKELEDPTFVVSRKANKVAIRLDVARQAESAESGKLVFGFYIQFTHHVSNSTGGVRDTKVHTIPARVFVDLGKA